jgi:hypothetical protein
MTKRVADRRVGDPAFIGLRNRQPMHGWRTVDVLRHLDGERLILALRRDGPHNREVDASSEREITRGVIGEARQGRSRGIEPTKERNCERGDHDRYPASHAHGLGRRRLTRQAFPAAASARG